MFGAQTLTDADIPGYREAVAREGLVRGAACLGLNEKICGLEVRPLTAWHMRWLDLLKSPFTRSKFTPEILMEWPDISGAILNFLWVVSPMFEPGSVTTKRSWWNPQPKTARDKFNEVFSPVVKLPVPEVCREILEYMDEAFIDQEEARQSQFGSDREYFAFEVAIACELHKHLGYRPDFWNAMPAAENPVRVPLKLVFQFRKARRKLEDGKALVTNKSERFIQAGLERIGKRNEELRRQNDEKVKNIA